MSIGEDYKVNHNSKRIALLQLKVWEEGFLSLALLKKGDVLTIFTESSVYRFEIADESKITRFAILKTAPKKISKTEEAMIHGSKLHGRMYPGKVLLGARLIFNIFEEDKEPSVVDTSGVREIEINNEKILPKQIFH